MTPQQIAEKLNAMHNTKLWQTKDQVVSEHQDTEVFNARKEEQKSENEFLNWEAKEESRRRREGDGE